MNARTFLKTFVAPTLVALVLVGCDSNPVAPIDPSERVFEAQEALIQYQAMDLLELELGTGIMASGRDSTAGRDNG
jgi:hypothetical protein